MFNLIPGTVAYHDDVPERAFVRAGPLRYVQLVPAAKRPDFAEGTEGTDYDQVAALARRSLVR